MISAITNGVKVSVEVFYQNEFSRPSMHEYIFTYRISIENQSSYTIKLLQRHWHILDSTGKHREVRGEGVVGKQPVLESGQSHVYVSGCNLESEFGRMWGSYTMERVSNGKQFEVDIPAFMMEVSSKLN
ncbi:MAG: Co2+/Mg2+ efflux protein ApaG [Sphingobacteriales bacterium]|nr:Co2+/Mg2+ efflux protein ApaG [Sphingobacteriales bacterium]